MDVNITLQNSSTRKASKQIPSGCSMSTASLFKSKENRRDVHRGKGRRKSFGNP